MQPVSDPPGARGQVSAAQDAGARPGPDTAVVLVNYASAGLLARNAPAAAPGLAVVVVDNFSSAAERAALAPLAAERSWELVLLDGNGGFGAGVNAGVRRAVDLGAQSVVLLNPDATIAPEDLAALGAAVRADPMSLVAPVIHDGRGRVWSTGGSLSLADGTTRSRGVDVDAVAEPWVTGACVAFHVSLWKLLGGMDDRYFMYWEDIDLSHRVLRAGGRIVVRRDLRAVHEVGGTQQAGGKSPLYCYYNCRNRLLFAAANLAPDDAGRWVSGSLGYAKAVALRGGRPAFLRHPVSLSWAVLRGTAAGVRLVRAAGRPAQPAMGAAWLGVVQRLWARPAVRWLVVALALLAAAGSVYVGATRATTPGGGGGTGSGDFQWSPTRLFLHGVDPYAARMAGSDQIILQQTPNYLQLLYWVLAPFGVLPFRTALWAWLVLNVAASGGIALWFGRRARLSAAGSLLLCAAFLCSTPVRLGLASGQQAVLVLVCAAVAFTAAERPWAGAPLAVALTKYSFAPLGLVLLVRQRVRVLVVAAAVLLAGAVGLALVTGTSLGTILVEPLELSRAVVGDGAADVMTLVSLTPWVSATSPVLTVLAVLTALLATACCSRGLRGGDWVFALGVAALISLFSFKHLAHDFVLLLPVAVLLLRMRGVRAVLGWAALGYHWFVIGIVSQLGTPINTPAVIVVSFSVLLLLLVVVATDPAARLPSSAPPALARRPEELEPLQT